MSYPFGWSEGAVGWPARRRALFIEDIAAQGHQSDSAAHLTFFTVMEGQ
jgi:hypothetical protein